MTEKPQGHLYTSARATHPDARRALPERSRRRSSRVERDRELFGFNSIVSDKSGLSSFQIFRNVFIVTIVFALIDSVWHHNLTWLTTIPFFLICVVSALRVDQQSIWASWTAPPLVFSLIAILTSFITHQALGNFPIAQITALILQLSANPWIVLITTGTCWVISRRIYVKQQAKAKRERRQRAEIESD